LGERKERREMKGREEVRNGKGSERRVCERMEMGKRRGEEGAVEEREH